MNSLLRLATEADSEELLRIYAPYIKNTAVTFETAVPSLSEFTKRVALISRIYPFLVYEADKHIAGYAYASQHRERAAFAYNVEVSIYVSPPYHGTGIAHKLYGCLFAMLARLGYKNAYANYTEPNEPSRKFHQKFGFVYVGTHHNTGYKLGKWHDVTWLEKPLGAYDEAPAHPAAITTLSHTCLE